MFVVLTLSVGVNDGSFVINLEPTFMSRVTSLRALAPKKSVGLQKGRR